MAVRNKSRLMIGENRRKKVSWIEKYIGIEDIGKIIIRRNL